MKYLQFHVMFPFGGNWHEMLDVPSWNNTELFQRADISPFYKGDNFCNFLFLLLHINHLLKKKEFAPKGSIIFPFIVEPFLEGRQTVQIYIVIQLLTFCWSQHGRIAVLESGQT